jgi:hypothetical protein
VFLAYFGAVINGIVFLISFLACSIFVYRKVIDFYRLVLCPGAWLKLFT